MTHQDNNRHLGFSRHSVITHQRRSLMIFKNLQSAKRRALDTFTLRSRFQGEWNLNAKIGQECN